MIIHTAIMVSGKYSYISMLYTYIVLVWIVSYLSNHVNHLFIMNQKSIHMAISFKINIVVSMVVIPLIVYMELVLLF